MSFISNNDDQPEKTNVDLLNSIISIHSIKNQDYGFEFDTQIGGLKQINSKSKNWKVFLPSIAYSTDNAAMIGIAGYYKLLQKNYGSISDNPQARLKI